MEAKECLDMNKYNSLCITFCNEYIQNVYLDSS